jgi:hypothetical protein
MDCEALKIKSGKRAKSASIVARKIVGAMPLWMIHGDDQPTLTA